MSLDKCRGRDLAIGKYPASFHPSSRPLTLTPFESDVCRPRFFWRRLRQALSGLFARSSTSRI
jgi:hypothetical protein